MVRTVEIRESFKFQRTKIKNKMDVGQPTKRNSTKKIRVRLTKENKGMLYSYGK